MKSDTEAYNSDEELDSSMLENLHWCRYECCVTFSSSSLEECKCCKKNPADLLAEKL